MRSAVYRAKLESSLTFPIRSNRLEITDAPPEDEIAVVPIGRSGGGAVIQAIPRPKRVEQRRRIAIVSPEVGSGAGVPHYWLALARALSITHEVHVFTAKMDGARPEGVVFHSLPSMPIGWFLGHMSFYLAARGRFLLDRLLGRRPFDLVFGIGALTPFADVATVHFVQAREIELQRQGLFPRPRPLAGLASLDYALYSRVMAWMGSRFYRNSHAAIVAISHSVKTDLALFEGANAASITVVPNGVDVERFAPSVRSQFRESTRKALGLSDDEIAVLFVGNSWGRKGLSTAIQAISGPGQASVRLVVVGAGDPANFLAGLSAELTKRIIFAGSESGSVERYYAAADVFILPTLYEPFGLVILEALASGLPSIISGSAGAAEWLNDGFDAVFLTDPGDGPAARKALRSIIDNPPFAASLSANGRAAAERFRWIDVGAQLIEAAAVRQPVLMAGD